MVNEIEVKASQGYIAGKIETVSIDSVHLNKNQSLVMAELEMHEGANITVILYKIDMVSKGNIYGTYSKDCLKTLQKMNSKRL